jgi:translation initiation factor IF-2
MPVRIYDIARRLGIENKEVLAKAKELGITGARVPSSSLDKITAEFLESHLISQKPAPEPLEAAPPPTPEPIIIVKGPQEAGELPGSAGPGEDESKGVRPIKKETEAPPDVEPGVVPVESGPPPGESVIPLPPADETAAPVAEPQTAETEPVQAEHLPPAEPPPPPGPQIGDKVGFIKLPTRPGARSGRGAPASGVKEEAPTVRSKDVRERRDHRDGRGQPALNRPGQTSVRPSGKPEPQAPPKFLAPAGGELITLKPPIIVRDLAEKLNRKPYQLIADLIELKVMASVNQAIDEETAKGLCAKYGFRFEVEKRERGGGIVHTHVKKVELPEEDRPEDLQLRAPVVTIMGHVDHGKTTLLDVIRKANVAAGEAGGITQHIGAYTISVPHPDRKNELQQITFLDTPGHAAFSAMRARGANVTDIVILVVAANDGVMPQTVEAINHAQAAHVPIIVAVNKCDHPAANPMRARQQLQEKGLMPDDWGGETIFVDVSALTKQGVDKLLEMIVLQSELLELKANPNRRARGNVVESGLSPGGPTASVLVRTGTLRTGDTIVCGPYWGKVRALINDEGKRLKEAGPSVAVKVLGLNGVPEAGLEFNVVEDDKTARLLVEERKELARQENLEAQPAKVTLEDIIGRTDKDVVKELKIVVKADAQGSVEAIVDALNKIESDKVTLQVIHSAVGTITENDIHLASASKAIVLGFHTRLDNGVSEAAKREGVQIKLYSIIYELIDEVRSAMAGLLEPILKETQMGLAEVRKVFELSKGGNVAGCVVNSGRIAKGKARIMRRKNLLYEGNIQSLRRFQDEVNEVRSGMECGIRMESFHDFQPGDTIECFTTEKVAAKL